MPRQTFPIGGASPRLLAGFLLAICSLLAAGCASRNGLPFITYFGTPWSEASINGQPGIFLVDTGAGITVVDEEFAARAGLEASGTKELRSPAGRFTAETAWADSISFGPFTHRHRLVVLQNMSDFVAPGGRRQDGLIGCDFLLEYAVLFRPDQAQIKLHQRPAPSLSGMVPHRLELDAGTPLIEVFFPGSSAPVWGRLDTGSAYGDETALHLDVARPLAERLLGERLQQPPDGEFRLLSLTGITPVPVYDFGPVRILGKTFERVRLIVREHGGGAFLEEEAVLIPGGLLRHFRAVELDFPRRRAWALPRD